MNYEFEDYGVHIILNPGDITIYMGNVKNKRVYKSTFIVDDFENAHSLGGLNLVETVLVAGFDFHNPHHKNVEIIIVEQNDLHILLKINISSIIPLSWTIKVDSCRVDDDSSLLLIENIKLKARIKELEDEIKRVNELNETKQKPKKKLLSTDVKVTVEPMKP